MMKCKNVIVSFQVHESVNPDMLHEELCQRLHEQGPVDGYDVIVIDVIGTSDFYEDPVL